MCLNEYGELSNDFRKNTHRYSFRIAADGPEWASGWIAFCVQFNPSLIHLSTYSQHFGFVVKFMHDLCRHFYQDTKLVMNIWRVSSLEKLQHPLCIATSCSLDSLYYNRTFPSVWDCSPASKLPAPYLADMGGLCDWSRKLVVLITLIFNRNL